MTRIMKYDKGIMIPMIVDDDTGIDIVMTESIWSNTCNKIYRPIN